MASESRNQLAIRLELEGSRQALAAFRNLPKDATKELRQASLELSKMLSGKIRTAGQRQGAQAALLTGTVKARFDRVPSVRVGGSKSVGRHGVPAWALLIGSEFGVAGQGGRGPGSGNFRPHGFQHRNPGGYWIFPTVRHNQAEIAKSWSEAADRIIRKWSAD